MESLSAWRIGSLGWVAYFPQECFTLTDLQTTWRHLLAQKSISWCFKGLFSRLKHSGSWFSRTFFLIVTKLPFYASLLANVLTKLACSAKISLAVLAKLRGSFDRNSAQSLGFFLELNTDINNKAAYFVFYKIGKQSKRQIVGLKSNRLAARNSLFFCRVVNNLLSLNILKIVGIKSPSVA